MDSVVLGVLLVATGLACAGLGCLGALITWIRWRIHNRMQGNRCTGL